MKTEVILGQGKIKIFRAHYQDETFDRVLALADNDEERPIGEAIPMGDIGKSVDEVNAFLEIQFLNIESLQVLMDVLQEMKDGWGS